MTRKVADLLGSQAFGDQLTQNVIDPSFGGQGGYAPNLAQWLNNQAYVSKPTIAVVLEAPGFFSLMTDPNKWVEILRAVFETHVRTIEGLRSGITWTFDEHAVGRGGEVQQEVVDAKRERSEPVIGLIDKAGLPFQNFFRIWGQYGMMDPETGFALASNINITDNQPWLADKYTATVMFFEPDMAHKRVVKAWLCTNMMPMNNGDEDGSRDPTAPGTFLELSIPFTALTQVGTGPKLLAQTLLDAMNRTNANPYQRAAFIDGMDAEVAAVDQNVSYASTIQTVVDTQIETSVAPGQ